MITPKSILITIDVEDWFQVENFKPYIPFSSWPERELRVERNVHKLLDLFDELEIRGQKSEAERWKLRRWEGGRRNELNSEVGMRSAELTSISEAQSSRLKGSEVDAWKPGNYQRTTNKGHSEAANKQHTTYHKHTEKVRCTFFVLGWLAERLPSLVREIQSRGHEVASHGYNHQLPDQLSAAELKTDLTDSKKQLEDLSGSPVTGYRAPSFAVNDDILKIVEDCGYLYDSSYNSFGLHGRYGKISLNGAGKCGIAHNLSDNFYELPISNLHLPTLGILAHFRHFRHFHLPFGGGGYFRLMPGPLFRLGIKHILGKEGAYLFYMHPWEIDPDQPRVREASTNFKFRHYNNLAKTYSRLKDLIENFNSCNFITCNQYLDELV
jgi:polysaccharide deacetylase family protein (PEP-CTERM system associated)